MKFHGVDFSRKYIIMEIAGEEITISFYESPKKGIYDVRVYQSRKGCIPIVVKNTYPGIPRRLLEFALLTKMGWKIFEKYLQRNITRSDI